VGTDVGVELDPVADHDPGLGDRTRELAVEELAAHGRLKLST
jgi:hypothetical protein